MAKPMKYKFGGVLRKKMIGGQEVARGDQSSSMVRKALASKGISDNDGDEVDGASAKMRLDRPGRKRGGAVSCKADGGPIDDAPVSNYLRKRSDDHEFIRKVAMEDKPLRGAYEASKEDDKAQSARSRAKKMMTADMPSAPDSNDKEASNVVPNRKAGGSVARKHEMAGGFMNKSKKG